MNRLVAWLALTLAIGCAGRHGQAALSPPAPPTAPPLRAGEVRCTPDRCPCSAPDEWGAAAEGSKVGAVPAGYKRFELRTGRGFDAMSIAVADQGTLHKDTSQAPSTCGYIDLPPGRWPVRMKIKAQDPAQGVHPRLLINEYGRNTGDWYNTFAFSCGTTQSCLKDDMKSWLATARRKERGIFDPCGSTRVQDLRWSAEHAADQTLEDLTLDFVLHVYKFEPRFNRGAADCRALRGGKRAEEELLR